VVQDGIDVVEDVPLGDGGVPAALGSIHSRGGWPILSGENLIRRLARPCSLRSLRGQGGELDLASLSRRDQNPLPSQKARRERGTLED
jgi:hypothetical protein